MNQAERRQLIADQLEDTPHRSNKWISRRLGVSHHTVKAVRGQLETGGQIAPLEQVEGGGELFQVARLRKWFVP